MKVFLDDERTPPDGWVLVRWPEEAIEHLKTGFVTDISLDHDLGDDSRGTGYDVLLWIEEAVVCNDFRPPQMKVHSANAAARVRMEAAIGSILRAHENNVQSILKQFLWSKTKILSLERFWERKNDV